MNRNLVEEINLLESTKDKLIKKLLEERYRKRLAYASLAEYKNNRIYITQDIDHCIDMMCKYERELEMRRERVCVLTNEVRNIELKLTLLYEQYDIFDSLEFNGGYF